MDQCNVCSSGCEQLYYMVQKVGKIVVKDQWYPVRVVQIQDMVAIRDIKQGRVVMHWQWQYLTKLAKAFMTKK